MTIFIQTLRGYRVPIAILSGALFAFTMIFCYTFRAFGGAEGLGTFLESLPVGLAGLLRAIGIEQPTAENYIAAAYQDPRFLIILHAFAIGTASAALAGEVERGTALYLLSRPISRISIVLAK